MNRCTSSLIPARSNTFMEIDYDNIFYGHSPSLLIQEGLLSVTSESICTEYLLTT